MAALYLKMLSFVLQVRSSGERCPSTCPGSRIRCKLPKTAVLCGGEDCGEGQFAGLPPQFSLREAPQVYCRFFAALLDQSTSCPAQGLGGMRGGEGFGEDHFTFTHCICRISVFSEQVFATPSFITHALRFYTQ